MTFRLLVCGGREFADRRALVAAMNAAVGSHRDVLVIHGGARGADRLAGLIAASVGIPCEVYEAEWDRYGRSAGHRRNQRMLVEGKPDLVLAAPGGIGTANMVRIAREAGVAVVEMRA